MSKDDHTQAQIADDAREGESFDRSLPGAEGPHVALHGNGSWGKLLLLLEVSPDALVMVDASRRIVGANNQAQALFGYTHAEIEGQPLEVLLPERFRAVHALHREQFATSPLTRPMGVGLALYGRRKDGSEFPADISLSSLLFDGRLHVLAAVRDITARSRLEAREHAARETAEARLALLQVVLDELPTCVYFATGSEARLVLANRAAVTLWGSEWPVGQPMLEFLTTHHIHLFDTNGQVLPPAAFAPLRALQEGRRCFTTRRPFVTPMARACRCW
jgi:PAS domain S-box-containing protein